MNTQSQTQVSQYLTGAEAEETVETVELDLMEVTEDDQEPGFDYSNDDDFDQSKDGDQDAADENM
jgi:hypothetical protein